MRRPAAERLRRQRAGSVAAGIAVAVAVAVATAMADPVDLTPLPEPTPAAPPTASPSTAPAGGFIFADSDRRELTAQEVAALPCDKVLFARNEIFARHGRYFQRDDLIRYFSQFAWYKPHSWTVKLTPVEQENVRRLAEAGRRC